MTVTSGTRLGPYEILGAIGEGGMGEVYKATDTRLNRTVAIKVLPPHFAGDADMKQRFDREAQTIAGLNHPHICTLHDVGEQDGVSFLVMEHIEGETLAARISRGALPIDEALKVALEIIDALDKAHRQNIVHRDLKPANIMLTKGGTKLLDFGLAKWASSQPGSHAAQETRLDVTAKGTMIGTMQYMSPEQVEGRDADSRTDLFGFGAVVYEMLTGKKAFEGKTQASLIGAIMKAEPRPVSHLAQMTPPVLDHVVSRCLAKDPDERWQTAHDLMVQLAWISRSRTDTTVSPAIAEAERKSRRLMTIMTTVALALAAGLAAPAYLYWRGPAEPEALQFRHTVVGLNAPDISISPDGRTIAFVAKPDQSGGAPSLYVRPVGGVTARKMAGTDNASLPFWSPDSTSIAYVAAGRLKKVAAAGGASEDLSDAKDFSGGAWSAAGGGTILFGTSKGISRVSAEGGSATVITELGQGETGHFWPSFLADGTHYTYLAWSEDAATRAVYVGTLATKDRQKLMAEESNAVYAAPGYLFFHRGPTLFAQPFNAKTLAFTGEPAQMAGGVAVGQTGRGLFDVSQTGALIYFQGSGGGASGRGGTVNAQFGFVDRKGGRVEIGVEAGDLGDLDLSPNGSLIAVTKQEPGARSSDIWVVDWRQNRHTRLTTDGSDDINPVWRQPDGQQIAFTTWRKGNADIYIKNANNVGDETPLIQTPLNESIEDWSKDGKYIAFGCGQDEFQDICAVEIDPAGKPGKPFTVVTGRYHKNEPQFSYDGKWLAYTSDINEPNKYEVFVQSFPAGDIKQQISRAGGGQPRWRQDGKEIFFRALDNRLMFAGISLGARIEPGVPDLLFISSSGSPTSLDPTRHMWTPLPDGQRFLTRINPGLRGTAAGTAGTGRDVDREFRPSGQVGGRAGGLAPVSSGLTVLLHWPSALPKGDR